MGPPCGPGSDGSARRGRAGSKGSEGGGGGFAANRKNGSASKRQRGDEGKNDDAALRRAHFGRLAHAGWEGKYVTLTSCSSPEGRYHHPLNLLNPHAAAASIFRNTAKRRTGSLWSHQKSSPKGALLISISSYSCTALVLSNRERMTPMMRPARQKDTQERP